MARITKDRVSEDHQPSVPYVYLKKNDEEGEGYFLFYKVNLHPDYYITNMDFQGRQNGSRADDLLITVLEIPQTLESSIKINEIAYPPEGCIEIEKSNGATKVNVRVVEAGKLLAAASRRSSAHYGDADR